MTSFCYFNLSLNVPMERDAEGEELSLQEAATPSRRRKDFSSLHYKKKKHYASCEVERLSVTSTLHAYANAYPWIHETGLYFDSIITTNNKPFTCAA